MTLASLVVAAALVLAPASTPADNPLGFADVEARARFDAGMEAWHADDYPTAERLLEAAYALEPKPALLYSLGQLARLQGDCREATERFEAFLASEPGPKAAAEARVNLERCAAELAAAPPEPEPAPAPAPAPSPTPPPPQPVPPPPKPDALGISLTVVGSAVAVVGVGLLAGAFSVQQRAEDERGIDRFERGVQAARTQYWTGVGLATAGTAALVGGVVRLVLVKRRARRR
jgi:hypothetical protein